jgi:uncharacterized protein (DUF2461 family)
VLGSILRIHRDTRFSRDPSPYKDHLDFWFWEGERRAVSGFFARLTPEHLGVGASCHGLDKRPPAGVAADERVQTAAVLSECMRHWSALAPLHRCLTGNIQAT